MTVLYNKHEPDPEAEKELGVSFATLDELLTKSDFVTIHVPLTDETRHMVGADAFAKMKKGSYLINTARGPIIDETVLIAALQSGNLAGAALDVYENEPIIPSELLGMQNVITTPHIASATFEARAKMGEMAVGAILDVLDGKKPANIVNEEVWEKRRK
jgi:phosphoglycerate dehydrogenase-like enzyme